MIPFNGLLGAFLALFFLSTGFRLALELLNVSNVKRNQGRLPAPFQGIVDEAELAGMDRYTLDRTRFSIVESIAARAVFLGLLLSGLLPWLEQTVRGFGFVWAGLAFFAAPAFLCFLFDLPFDYFGNFVIEARHGFNTRTRRLWALDSLKSLLIGGLLGGVLLGLFLLMVDKTGPSWWIWAWAILLGFQLLMLVLYPLVIAPLFNTFTPVEDRELAERIRSMASEQGVNVEEIVQMDAGRRSRHTNAYFTGLGRVKRIVLYDTLLQAHDQDELLAVLAHEMAHLKMGHVWKRVLLFGAASLVLLFAASLLIRWEPIYQAFAFSGTPLYAGLFLAGVIWEPAGFFLSPLSMAVSRRFERQADRFVLDRTGGGEALARALERMAGDNLANLHPHPLYVRFHYSHPPLVERIRALVHFS
ncbi:MAG: M48 family metallopeptidase [Deltaproteobacteria bacterium]|nr:M48 family metallopeptidase [Deltaproteobacteria bacterium]